MGSNSKKLSIEYCKEVCDNLGYELLTKKYKNNRQKLIIKDKDGYFYETTIDDIRKNIINKIFSKYNSHTIENIHNYIRINNLTCKLLSTEYINNITPLEFECKCGNNFHSSLAGFKSGKTTCDECSGFTRWDIYSVRQFVQDNSNCELLSSEYINNSVKLNFKCECGRKFSTSFAEFQFQNRRKCKKCSKKVNTTKKSIEEVLDIYKSYNLIPLFNSYMGYNIRHDCLNEDGYKLQVNLSGLIGGKNFKVFGKGNKYTTENIIRYLKLNEPNYTLLEEKVVDCKTKINIKCNKGHIYQTSWTNFLLGRRCPKCKSEKASERLVGNINDFKTYVTSSTNGEYECISDEYINSNTKLKIKHNECGNIYEVTPAKFTGSKNRNGCRCPICNQTVLESTHATVLKQLFLKYKKDVVLEDKSCINPLTNHCLPTDIVCHDERLVVEVQSWYHDKEEQQIKDTIKKDYWENKGYKVYTPDVRDYSSLSMAQIFFPNLKEIPKWIDYKYGKNNLDINEVQKIINLGKNTREVGDIFGVSRNVIQNLIKNGEVILPDNHWRKMKNVKNIVVLDLDGNFINKFTSATEASQFMNMHQTSISKACKNNINYHYYNNYIWLYEEDYINNNYIIEKDKIKKGYRSVVKLTETKIYIQTYKTINEACKDNNISKDSIYRNIKNNKISNQNFIWMYKEDYEIFLNVI